MKTFVTVWFVFVLLISCSTTKKMALESFHQALIGQNEMKIFSMLGPPKSILPASGGGKVIIISGNMEGMTFHCGVNTAVNDPA